MNNIVKFDGAKVIGFKESGIKNTPEDLERIGRMWGVAFHSNLMVHADKHPIVATYYNYSSDASGTYDLHIGVSYPADADCEFEEGYETIELPAGTYMIFEGEVQDGQVLSDVVAGLWQQVWNNKNLKRTYQKDFEYYESSKKVILYIGIKE